MSWFVYPELSEVYDWMAVCSTGEREGSGSVFGGVDAGCVGAVFVGGGDSILVATGES